MMQRRRRALSALFAFAILCATAAAGGAAARRAPSYPPPNACEIIEDTGQLITLPWQTEGCHAARDAFRIAIAARMKFPGWYPPLTCVAGGTRYSWDSLSCAHARNLYAAGKIHPVWFGARPQRARPVVAPSAPPSTAPSP